MKEERLIGNSGVEEMRQQSHDAVEEIRQQGLSAVEEIRESAGVMNDIFSLEDNPEFINVETDNEERILGGRRTDGIKVENVGLETPSISIGGNVVSSMDDPEKRKEIELDNEEKILSYRKENGMKVECAGFESPKVHTDNLELSEKGMTEFQKALKEAGFNPGGTGDWSDAKSLEIPTPRCAMVNFTNPNGETRFPWAKLIDLEYIMEFYDMAGNYFKKEVIMNAQGNSSMNKPKKNAAIDICNNNGWDDDDTFKVRFGDWVAQDSFHLKAYYTNFFKGEPVVGYAIADKVMRSRGPLRDRPWKIGLLGDYTFGSSSDDCPSINDISLQMDNGARCMPDGFPCIVYLDGEFYGVYSFQTKKHRDNYHLSSKKAKHIHLDGDLYTSFDKFWTENIDWTAFEVRNPKNLVYAEAHDGSFKYDADVAQAEIAGTDKNYDGNWAAGSYAIGRVVKVGKNYFINQVADNTAEPITQDASGNKNTADSPDFKNKTHCGWINCTTSVEVKQHVKDLAKRKVDMDNLGLIQTPNGQISIKGYQGLYNDTDNFAKGICASDGNGNYYMSIHTENTGNPLTDTNYWVDVTQALSDIFGIIDTYFDRENIIDYLLVGQITANYDGFGKNWQWVTYDGDKWFMCFYDLDGVFGANFMGQWADPADHSADFDYLLTQAITAYPFINYLNEFYMHDIKERYEDIRGRVGITHDYIINLIKDWSWKVGQDNYAKEYKKWPDTECNRDLILNDGWEIVPNALWGIGGGPSYDPTVEYHAGDEVWRDRRKFKATKTLQGVFPYQQLGYRDSLFRISTWLTERFTLLDTYYSSKD